MGQRVGAWAINLNGATISTAETTALKEGPLLARQKGINTLMVEGDSKLVIQVVLWRLGPSLAS